MYRLVLVGILGIFLTACQSMTGKTAGQNVDDATMSTSIQGKLTSDKASNFTRINVDTERGVVTLNGVVQTAEDKMRAEELARKVDGVTKVNNNLQIESMSSNKP